MPEFQEQGLFSLGLTEPVSCYWLSDGSGSASVAMTSRCTAAGPAVTLWPWPCATRAWGAGTAVSARRTACPRSTWTAACQRSGARTQATTQSKRSRVKRRRRRKRGRRLKGRTTATTTWWENTSTRRWDNQRVDCHKGSRQEFPDADGMFVMKLKFVYEVYENANWITACHVHESTSFCKNKTSSAFFLQLVSWGRSQQQVLFLCATNNCSPKLYIHEKCVFGLMWECLVSVFVYHSWRKHRMVNQRLDQTAAQFWNGNRLTPSVWNLPDLDLSWPNPPQPLERPLAPSTFR